MIDTMIDTPLITHELGIQAQGIAEKIGEFEQELSDYVLENERYIVSSPDENAFLEECKRILLLGDKAYSILGDLVLRRLTNKHGGDCLGDDNKPTRDARSTLAYWAAKLDCQYHRLDRLVRAAKTRQRVPEVAQLPITAQAEIGSGNGASSDDGIVRDRLDALDHLDPNRENSVDAVRTLKQSERVGIERFHIIQYPDLSVDGRAVLLAGQCKEGEMVEFARLEWIPAKNGDNQEAVGYYQEWVEKRIHAHRRDPLPFDPLEEEEDETSQ